MTDLRFDETPIQYGRDGDENHLQIYIEDGENVADVVVKDESGNEAAIRLNADELADLISCASRALAKLYAIRSEEYDELRDQA